MVGRFISLKYLAMAWSKITEQGSRAWRVETSAWVCTSMATRSSRFRLGWYFAIRASPERFRSLEPDAPGLNRLRGDGSLPQRATLSSQIRFSSFILGLAEVFRSWASENLRPNSGTRRQATSASKAMPVRTSIR